MLKRLALGLTFSLAVLAYPNDTTRLASLCKVWGKVKFSHPALAYNASIDWDRALVEAIPLVLSAGTSQQYGAAVDRMLSQLNDPATRVVSGSEPEGLSRFAETREADGVLVFRLGSPFQLTSADSSKAVASLMEKLPSAKAVVLDLRSDVVGGDYGAIMVSSTLAPLERMLTAKPLMLAGERSRVHYGYVGSSFISSGQYRSVFLTQDGKRVLPAQTQTTAPIVVLLNQRSEKLPSIAALQADGRALVVFEGSAGDCYSGKTEPLSLEGDITARVRISEAVTGDLKPDRVVASGGDAVKTATDLARNFGRSQVQPAALPLNGLEIADRSYPGMPYPSEEYRLLAIFRIWNVIDKFYPYKSLIDGDWDKILLEYIPRFRAAKDAKAYTLAVVAMTRRLSDSHVYIAGGAFNEIIETGYPIVSVTMVEGKPVITGFRDEKRALKAGASIGDVVVSVEGEDAGKRLARYSLYFAGSTKDALMRKTAQHFMNGLDGTTVSIKVRKRDGSLRDLMIPRRKEDYTTLYHRERTGPVVKVLKDNIGYVDLDRLEFGDVDAMFAKLKNTKGIIFDMRGYPNGTVWQIAPRLARKQQVVAAVIQTVAVGAPPQHALATLLQRLDPIAPGLAPYRGKTVMLMDERSQSQAEHTGLFLKAANGTRLVGSHTAGADGEITAMSLPGGIAVGFTGQSVTHPDGRQLQRIGLVPDVLVKPTIKGVQEGRDEVLEKGVEVVSRAK